MLACARLRDDALFVHALREQDLPQRVVDLVRAGVIQVLPFEQDLRTDFGRESWNCGDRISQAAAL